MNIVLLIGMPASGKSTWLAKNKTMFNDYKVISSDDYLDKIANDKNKTYDEIFNDHIKDADAYFWNELKTSLQNKENIFVDRTNLSEKSRRRILSQVPKGYKKHAIVFEIDPIERTTRLIDRKYKQGKSIPDNVIDSMIKSYQYPTKDEGFDTITKI